MPGPYILSEYPVRGKMLFRMLAMAVTAAAFAGMMSGGCRGGRGKGYAVARGSYLPLDYGMRPNGVGAAFLISAAPYAPVNGDRIGGEERARHEALS